MIQVHISVGDLQRGHLGSPEVTNRFLLISHDWKQLATGLIMLVLLPRIDWHATWPPWFNMWPLVTLTWGQILTWPFKVRTYLYVAIYLYVTYISICYHAPIIRALTRGTWWCPNYAATILCLKVVWKKNFFCEKQLFWPFFYLKRQNYWR